MFPFTGVAAGGGGGGTPRNKGGLNTNPTTAARTAWQYLTSIWDDCLGYFAQDARFDSAAMKSLLVGSRGAISWWDLRVPSAANRTVGSLLHNGDSRTLAQANAGHEATTLAYTPNVLLSSDRFTNNTQTQQVASTVHEALHVLLHFDDAQLQGWLMNFGFTPGANSGAITDWVAEGCK